MLSMRLDNGEVHDNGEQLDNVELLDMVRWAAPALFTTNDSMQLCNATLMTLRGCKL